jgi:antibiotic biosynthesis monooxygenase (ABM) superfamily enzyme
MTTVQLRRYVVEPGRMDDFLAWFPAVIPVREKYGFRLLFALAERERDTFTWAVSYDGDEAAFTEAVEAYSASPERAAAFETFPHCVTSMEIGFAEDALSV